MEFSPDTIVVLGEIGLFLVFVIAVAVVCLVRDKFFLRNTGITVDEFVQFTVSALADGSISRDEWEYLVTIIGKIRSSK